MGADQINERMEYFDTSAALSVWILGTIQSELPYRCQPWWQELYSKHWREGDAELEL